MADTTLGTSAATAAHSLNFAQAGRLMHGMAYRREQGFKVTPEQYHCFSTAVQAVEDAATCLQRTRAGIEMLLDMLEESSLERYYADAMRGLLGPIAQHLEQHAQALNATVDTQEG